MLITKYKNRKYYINKVGTVTMDQLTEALRLYKGDIQAKDYKGNDITREVLIKVAKYTVEKKLKLRENKGIIRYIKSNKVD